MKNNIDDLRDYAELAQASYFNLVYIKEQESKSFKIGKDRFFKDENSIETLHYLKALSYVFKDYFIYDDSIVFYPQLNGEFGELQAQNFAKRYLIKFHQANTASGFSATLFQNKFTKEFIFEVK
ncbi:hypothetical protein [Campylobacter troglodytis]|uniref:hypothetical protein n=1 Tax=Campylobacter troglodytis TaxID=654363 RepID=UPI00115A6E89|nr:hypothetical protein [Campylobacter troglodytis]TQR52995.1 hypothetical protein DMC01_12450 [Campylobacter troglodytis]